MKLTTNGNLALIELTIPAPETDTVFTGRNEDGEIVYSVEYTRGSVGVIGCCGARANTVANGHVAIALVEPDDIEIAAFKKKYGSRLLDLKAAEAGLTEAAAREQEELDNLFEEIVEA